MNEQVCTRCKKGRDLINLIEELQIQELGKIAQVLLCILNKLKILNE